ncbi:MAG: cytochrome b [Alphaproteobacteria bacterium]|nr:cytochrome b [Alphaproteobacteria bacterium]
MKSTATASYNSIAKTLHWLIALGIIFMLTLGWCFDFFPKGESRFFAIQLHKSVGITILLLVFLRVLWRLTHAAPPFPATMPLWEQRAAYAGHFLLYAAMICMPLSGWTMVSASAHNIPTILYGLVPWPNVPGVQDSPHRELIDHVTDFIHANLALAFAALIVGHAAAAWRHHLVAKDDILLRMAPRFVHGILYRLRGQK